MGSVAKWKQKLIQSQPQRGCIPQPRVAVLGYPGGISAGVDHHYSRATPTGLHPPAQDCRTRLPWGDQRKSEPSLFTRNPNVIASQPHNCDTRPYLG